MLQQLERDSRSSTRWRTSRRASLIIEAAPERPELKHELFAARSHVAPDAVLASNNSPISITAIARAAANPSLGILRCCRPPPGQSLRPLPV